MSTQAETAGDSGAATISSFVILGVLAAYIWFYINVPIDSAIRMIAFFGMFVFMIVVIALLLLFDRWWKGARDR